jgi:hypothetical protein
VEQTQKETRDNTTCRIGATLRAGAERNVRKSARVLADPLFLVSARANAKKRMSTDASNYGLDAALLQWEEEGDGYRWVSLREC